MSKKKKIKGVLPNSAWLQKNGYIGLHKCMRKHPKLFKHIEQDRKLKMIGDWMTIAEELVEKNNGILPNIAWLDRNGYYGISRNIRLHPEKFSHMKQDKKLKMIDEWISIAEELAEKNDGILPYGPWLREHRFSSIQNLMVKFPEKFSHIKQHRKRKTSNEWLRIAKKMAMENNDKIPCSYWLSNNKYGGLDLFIRRHPEIFKGMKQEYYFGRTKKVRNIG